MRRHRLLLRAVPAAGLGLVVAAGACTTPPITATLRSLEESGRVSFVCLGPPSEASPLRALRECRNVRTEDAQDFGSGGGGTSPVGNGGSGGSGGTGGATATSVIPHLYALVTQTFRGEVAVVDLTTADSDAVIDQDPTAPGPSFLPVGAQPVGIVSTPGSTATFVTVGEVGREGIFAIPSLNLRRTPDDPNHSELSSWPACALPAVPGEPLLVNDPRDEDGRERTTCTADYSVNDLVGPDGEAGTTDDLTEAEAHPNGWLQREGAGRQKLVVPLPSLGGIAILDAQELLDRPAGELASCAVERWVLLGDEVPPVDPPPPTKGPACVNPVVEKPLPTAALPQPAGIAFAADTLYASDLALPLIHRIAMDSPCEPIVLPPLLPTSAEQPSRVVTTSRVAVTQQPTASLKRYLYANDVDEGTIMVFDVSDGATGSTPLFRNHPEWTPVQPRDRIRLGPTVRDILVVSRDVPEETPSTGVAPEGTFCDPNPSLTACTSTTLSCDPGTLYRTAADFSEGAGPYKLRGTFGFALLTNGQIGIIDIEDLDAPCRVPAVPDTLLGCEPPTCTKAAPTCPSNYKCPSFDAADPPGTVQDCTVVKTPLVSTDEDSCNVVSPNSLRSAVFVTNGSEDILHSGPGIDQLPQLYDKTGANVDPTSPESPLLRATLPATGGGQPTVAVGGLNLPIEEDGGPIGGEGHVLALNLETPQAQSIDQSWAVTFEGPLPRFGSVSAVLNVALDGTPPADLPNGVYDSNGRYCEGGVQSKEAVREQLLAAGKSAAVAEAEAQKLADRIQLTAAFAEEDDDFWDTTATNPKNACTFDQCRTWFGQADAALGGRDFVISEAYQDRLLVNDASGTTSNADGSVEVVIPSLLTLSKCCFPGLVTYFVRPGNQWTIVGEASGFLHHVVTDPDTGVCRDSCDPIKERMNGRAVRSPTGKVKDGDPTAFINQMFRFAVVDGTSAPARDMQFRFATTASFTPLTITLIKDSRDVAPVGISFVGPTNELAITDGALQGLITVNLSSVDAARQFF